MQPSHDEPFPDADIEIQSTAPSSDSSKAVSSCRLARQPALVPEAGRAVNRRRPLGGNKSPAKRVYPGYR